MVFNFLKTLVYLLIAWVDKAIQVYSLHSVTTQLQIQWILIGTSA